MSVAPEKYFFASATFGSSLGSMSCSSICSISFMLNLYSLSKKSALYNAFCLLCVSGSSFSKGVPLTGLKDE